MASVLLLLLLLLLLPLLLPALPPALLAGSVSRCSAEKRRKFAA
jgi:hypothetical protein